MSNGLELVVDEQVDLEYLKRFEKIYVENPNHKSAFDYAYCLVRSNKQHVRLGIQLLEDLLKRDDVGEELRDYLYYLSIGYLRLSKYDQALKFVETLLRVEPENNQAQNLQQLIKKRMKKDAAVGAAVLGGAAAVGGALLVGAIAAAAALSKK